MVILITVLSIIAIAFLPWICATLYLIGDVFVTAAREFVEGWKEFIRFIFGKGES